MKHSLPFPSAPNLLMPLASMLECLKVASVIITGEPGLAGNWGQRGGASFCHLSELGTHQDPCASPTQAGAPRSLQVRGPWKQIRQEGGG